MMLSTSQLLGDPLFQLNVVLWLTRPLPRGSSVAPLPLLHQAGFTVYAIAPPLAPPPAVRLAAAQAQMDLQERTNPDVVLHHEGRRAFVFTECKGSSFKPSSSDSRQARSLLVICGPHCSEALGLDPQQVSEAALGVVAPQWEREQFVQTLSELARDLEAHGLAAGRFAILGLVEEGDSIGLEVDGDAASVLSLPSGTNTFLALDAATDPRPLYFIPYDPDLNQSQEERAFCKKALFERAQATVIAAVGHAECPCDLRLEADSVLNDAMLGAYVRWQDHESAKHMRRLCRQLVGAISHAVNAAAGGAMSYGPPNVWTVSLPGPEQREKVLDALERFSCDTLDLAAELPLELFGESDSEAPPAGD